MQSAVRWIPRVLTTKCNKNLTISRTPRLMCSPILAMQQRIQSTCIWNTTQLKAFSLLLNKTTTDAVYRERLSGTFPSDLALFLDLTKSPSLVKTVPHIKIWTAPPPAESPGSKQMHLTTVHVLEVVTRVSCCFKFLCGQFCCFVSGYDKFWSIKPT